MDFSQYFIRLTGSALICASVGVLIPEKGTIGNVMKLLRTVVMVLCLIQPWMGLRFEADSEFWDGFRNDGEVLAAQGESYSRKALTDIITERTGTYIQDKAASLGGAVTVRVQLSDDTIPVPCAVLVTGDLSPYARAELSDYISREIGIPKEAQTWQAY